MATTAVSICSNALLLLGAQPINSFDEASGSTTGGIDRARIAANLYPSFRDSLLRAHPWNCATKRVVLSPDSTAPAWGYAYRFTLPGDWLRTVQVGDDDSDIDFKSEGRYLLADESTLKLRYIFRNTNEATWDAALVALAEQGMAAAMAYPLTQSASLRDVQLGVYRDALKAARGIDGQDDPAQTLGGFELLNSRFSGGYGWRD